MFLRCFAPDRAGPLRTAHLNAVLPDPQQADPGTRRAAEASSASPIRSSAPRSRGSSPPAETRCAPPCRWLGPLRADFISRRHRRWPSYRRGPGPPPSHPFANNGSTATQSSTRRTRASASTGGSSGKCCSVVVPAERRGHADPPTPQVSEQKLPKQRDPGRRGWPPHAHPREPQRRNPRCSRGKCPPPPHAQEPESSGLARAPREPQSARQVPGRRRKWGKPPTLSLAV